MRVGMREEANGIKREREIEREIEKRESTRGEREEREERERERERESNCETNPFSYTVEQVDHNLRNYQKQKTKK